MPTVSPPALSPVPTDADVAEEMAANVDTAVDLLPPMKREDRKIDDKNTKTVLQSKDTSTTEDTKTGNVAHLFPEAEADSTTNKANEMSKKTTYHHQGQSGCSGTDVIVSVENEVDERNSIIITDGGRVSALSPVQLDFE